MVTNPSTAPLWSYGLATIANLGLAVHLMRRPHAGKLDGVMRFMIGALVVTCAWAGAGFVFALQPLPLTAIAHGLLDSLRYGAWYGFFFMLIYRGTPTKQASRPLWPISLGATIISAGVGAQLALLLLPSMAESLLRATYYAALAQAVFGLAFIEQLFRNTTADSSWNVKPLGIGLAAVFIFDLYFHSTALLFNLVDADAYAVRGFAYALVLPLIALTIYRTRARRLQVSLSQTAAFHTTSLAAAGLYLLIASAAGYYVRYLGGSWGGALQLAVLFVALVLMMLLVFSGTMRARIRVLVGKHFFRYRYDYREEWLRFTQALTSADDSHQIDEQVIRGLAAMVESPGGTLWLLDSSGRQYIQKARWNQPQSDASESAQGSLVRFLADSGWVLNLEEYRHLPGRYKNLTLPEWLLDMPNAWLVVPLSTANSVVGFVVLATSRTPLDINWEVNDLLRTAGHQAAAFLAQTQASEALLEARKFESFNRMSAFVVHDLKNIVTQLSLMIRNAERHAGNAEFQRDMLLTVQHSVERMKQLMLQLREGTTPADGTCGIDLGKVVERIRQSKSAQSPLVELNIKERIVARGHEDRIERVIGHLVQNAIEATPDDGRVWVTVERDGGMALVEVGDTGHGMSAEFMRDHLFRPFKSTKQAGMGIGAYESRQYVHELGGEIKVESEEQQGTRFRIKLPLIEVSDPASANNRR
jgi:putative PEP-CTERM system histidine kinase